MNNQISLDEIEFSTLSIIDDYGKVFFWKNRIFRAIYEDAVGKVIDIFSSGLINELVDNNLFPRSWITDYQLEGYGFVIEHEKIVTVSYPYEWSFSMLKDAAIVVLKINIIAQKYGYQTKDCHGFNIVFDGVNPKYVDLGSFFKIEDKSNGWIAYEEFLRFYYYPLSIWSHGNSYIARRMLLGGTAMSHEDFVLYKNPFYRLLNRNFLEKIINFYFRRKHVLGISSVKRLNKYPCGFGYLIIYFVNKILFPLLKVNLLLLQKKTQKLSIKHYRTTWGEYHDQFQKNNGIDSTQRFDRIINIIKGYKIETVTELAGNQGVFSILLLQQTKVKHVICSDADENAVEKMYLIAKKSNIKLTPVLLNFILPIFAHNRRPPDERLKSDIAIALAITHHLILTARLPIDIIFKSIMVYSKKYVCIEYMPLGLYDNKYSRPIPTWYTKDWFRDHFKKYFDIILEEKIEENRVLFFGELKYNCF